MAEWLPYLREALGGDALAEDRARDLLSLQDALTDAALPAAHRVQLLSHLDDLDGTRQVFLLPTVMSLLSSPCERVRRTVLNLVSEWVGQRGPLLNELTTLVGLTADVRKLQPVLCRLASLLREEPLTDERTGVYIMAPFASLSALRTPVFALSTLQGLFTWARNQSDKAMITVVEEFLIGLEYASTRELLLKWLTLGPMFLRYLLVAWMGETGLSLSSDLEAPALLLRSYREDPDPLVAAEAIHSYARLVQPDALATAVGLLTQEFRTFRTRRLDRIDGDPGDALRSLSTGLIHALARLATDHYPSQIPLRALRDLLVQGTDSLDLTPPHLSKMEKVRIFRAAVLLHGQNLSIRVKPLPKNRRLASVGLSDYIALDDPDGLLNGSLDPYGYEAIPVPCAERPNEPQRWVYQINRPWPDQAAASDLSALVSPVLSVFLDNPNPNPAKNEIWERAAREVDLRGPWILQTTQAVAQVLGVALDHGTSLDDPVIRPMFDYLCDIAAGANRIPTTRQTTYRLRLKNLTRRLLLNQLARDDVIAALSADGPRPLQAQLLVQLAMTSLRSLPGEPASRWIDNNLPVLRRIVQSNMHLRVRGEAGVLLRFRSWRSDQELHEELDRIRLPGGMVLDQCLDALCFVDDHGLSQLEERVSKQKRKPSEPMHVAAEQLARALFKGLPEPGAAEQWSAVCLETLDLCSLPLRLRLLQAYAKCPHLEPGNVRRLFDHLLRSSPASALRFFFDCLLAENAEHPRLLRQLIRLAEEVSESPLDIRLDLQGIRDRLQRGPVIQQLLAQQARRGGRAFFAFYLKAGEKSPIPETDLTTAAEGDVLWEGGGNGEDLITVLGPVGQPSNDLASTQADLVPAFVHCPQPSAGVRCVVQGRPVPAGTLDLHALPLSLEHKRDLLDRFLHERKEFLLLARATHSENNGRAWVDLGASAVDLASQHILTITRPVSQDEPVLVEVRVTRGQERALVEAEWVLVSSATAELPAYDLRGRCDALAQLEQLWRAHKQNFALQASVLKTIDLQNGMALCLLDTGFMWWRWDRSQEREKKDTPAVLVPSPDAPSAHTEIFLAPCNLSFENRPGQGDRSRAIEVFPATAPQVGGGRVLRGTLHPSGCSASGRRLWKGRVGSLELLVERQDLTGDLRTLFALDSLPDDHPTVVRLGNEPVTLRVTPGSRKLSILDAPPSWQTLDLILGVLAEQVTGATLVRIGSDGVFLLEVRRKGGVETEGLLPPLGLLARVPEGELFDEKGSPLSATTMKGRDGVHLHLRVVFGRLREDGRLVVEHDQGTPFLQVAQEDDANLRCRAAFPPDSLVRVRITSRQPLKLKLEAPPRLAGFPLEAVMVQPARFSSSYFARAEDDERDALVDGDWRPEGKDFALTVRQPQTNRLFIDHRSASSDVQHLLELEPGHALRGQVRTLGRSEALLVGGLRVSFDPLMAYLLPEQVSTSDLARAAQDQAICVTQVETRRPHRMGVTENMPEIPFLLADGKATGLVVSTPYSGSASRQVGVRWWRAGETIDAEPELSEEWTFLPDVEDLTRLWPGHVLEAEMRNEEVWLFHAPRLITGTTLYERLPLETWAVMFQEWANSPEGSTHGTLLQRPGDGHGWLFVMSPGCIVEVPPEHLAGAEHLREAWKLDVVELTLDWPTDAQAPTLCVSAIHKGFLRSWIGPPLELQVRWCNPDRSFVCVLTPPDEVEQGNELRLTLRSAELAPVATPNALAQRLFRGEKNLALTCTLHGFDLEVTRVVDDDYSAARFTYSLRPDLRSFRPNEAAINATQEKTLDEALAENDRLECVGCVAERGFEVCLEHYRHDAPIPLLENEQTWIRHTGQLVAPGWSGTLVVFRTSQGPQASLRRLRPLMLGEWLHKRRITRPGKPVRAYKLHYFGQVTADQLQECGREDLADDSDCWLLFEEQPGVFFIARSVQLTFLGERFDPHMLACGDTINRFAVIAATEAGEEPGLDILAVLPDISFQIQEFDREHKGIFFGNVRLVGGQIVLNELRGADFGKEPVGKRRLGRWQLVLSTPDEQQLKWLEDMERADDDLTVYLKFVKADVERGELVFRLLRLDEAFALSNLVWVRVPPGAPNDGVSPFGASLKLTVRPLQAGTASGDPQHDMFIPDSQFSTRRGRLRNFRNTAEGRVFLARVRDDGSDPEFNAIKLSLVENPDRPFGLLLREDHPQVIVNKVESLGQANEWLRVELKEEGVFVKLPLRHVDGLATEGRRCQIGDVLFLSVSPSDRVTVDRLLPGNMDYLPLDQRPIVLTRLWGSQKYRRDKVQKNQYLDCSLIGLPQLRGLCRVSDESLDSSGLVPQVAYDLSPRGDAVMLEESSAEGYVVGMLDVDQSDRPVLRERSGEAHRLRWSDVTFREGNPATRMDQLRKLTWYDTLPMRQGQPDETLENAELVARRIGNRVSLTVLADTPYPVDHLVEQFPTGGLGEHYQPPPRSYVVARNDPGRLVVEIAPGRYAELPTHLLRPLSEGPLVPGLPLSWSELAPGDLVELERVQQAKGAADEFLPSFRVRRLLPGNGRHLRVPFVSLLQRALDESLVLGVPGPAAIPADHLRHLLRDHVLDLHKLNPGLSRYQSVCDEFDRRGSALVLDGRVTSAVAGSKGWRHFIDIGLQVPIPGRTDRGDPSWLMEADAPLPQGTPLRVRVVELEHEHYNLQWFAYAVECEPSTNDRILIRSEAGIVKRYDALPRPGDAVMVCRREDSEACECQVLGYGDLGVRWVTSDRDPFELHRRDQREHLLPRLLPRPESAFWATIEEVDERSGLFLLSRRVQMEQVLPTKGRVGRARVLAPLNKRRLLVEVLGVPTILPTSLLCQGAVGRWFQSSVETLSQGMAAEVEGNSPTELEILALPNGAVSATGIYTLPSGRDEVVSVVEQIAPEGLLANTSGYRMFVPRRELAWCDLDPDVLARLFPPGGKLRISVPDSSGQGVFSHIRTREIRREIAWMRRAGAEPAYVVRVDKLDPHRTVVRGKSGVLMELVCEPGAVVPERFPAYVLAVDDARRVVRLSLERVAPRLWSFAETPAEFSVDASTSEVIKSRLSQLDRDLGDGPTAVAAWASGQAVLEASPRNLRLALATIMRHFDGDAAWATANRSPGEGSAVPRSIASVWREVSGLIAGDAPLDNTSAAARFAAGFWELSRGKAREALPHLVAACYDRDVSRHIDVWIALAHALRMLGDAEAVSLLPSLADRLRLPRGATAAEASSRLLAHLTSRLWADAVRTLPLPLFEPVGMSPQMPEWERWRTALVGGDLVEIKDVLTSPGGFSARHIARRIWLARVDSRLDSTLGELTDRLLEEIHVEEDDEPLDTRLYVLAAQLCFARGDVVPGWRYLNRVQPLSKDLEITAPIFWQSWMNNHSPSTDVDPLLEVLLEVLRRSRSCAVLEDDLVQRLWKALQKSHQRWILDSPVCRVVPRPPEDPGTLRQWSEDNAIPAPIVEEISALHNQESAN